MGRGFHLFSTFSQPGRRTGRNTPLGDREEVSGLFWEVLLGRLRDPKLGQRTGEKCEKRHPGGVHAVTVVLSTEMCMPGVPREGYSPGYAREGYIAQGMPGRYIPGCPGGVQEGMYRVSRRGPGGYVQGARDALCFPSVLTSSATFLRKLPVSHPIFYF